MFWDDNGLMCLDDTSLLCLDDTTKSKLMFSWHGLILGDNGLMLV